MGDHADDMEMYSGICEDHYWEMQERLSNRIWRTSDGDDICVDKMSDNHIDNAINYIESGRCDVENEWLEIFREEQQSRKKNIAKLFED